MRRRHGFTLVELIIVIAVIGVLAAILIPTFSNVIEKANAKSALSDGRNTVTQYVTEFTDKEMRGESMPENIIVYVKKAGKYYLYGYNTKGDGSIAISNGNPFKAKDIESLNAEWSWNTKQGDIPAPNPEEEYTDAATYGYLYLIPYTTDTHESAAPGYRGFFNTGSSLDYRDLTEEMDEKMGSDVTTMHGFLLPGSFTYQNDNAGAGTSTPSTPSTPTETEKFTVNFAFGNLPAEFQSKTTLPASTEVNKGTPVNSFTMGNAGTSDDDVYYTFEGWDKSGVINADTTLTAQWEKHEAVFYTLKFEGADGAAMPNLPAEQSLRAGTDISSIIDGAGEGATKAHATFTGWVCSGADYPASGNTNVTLTSNMTFKAQFSDSEYTLTFKSGDGTGSDYTITGKFNDEKTLPTLATCGFTAPTGKGFTNWKFSGGTRAAGAAWTITEDVTFTAEYEELKFTVHYAKTGSETVPQDKTYAVGTESVTLEASTYAWHKFNGYGTTLGQSGLSATASINTSAVAAGTTITVTPSWIKKTISIMYTGDGISDLAMLSAMTTLDPDEAGFKAEHTVIAQDALKGYERGLGFYAVIDPETYEGITCNKTTGSYLGLMDTYPAGSKLTFAEPDETTVSITLLGCIDYYEIKYAKGADSATGSMTPSQANGTNKGIVPAAACTFTNEGYNFTGWKDLEANKTYAVGENVTLNGKDVTLTAQWEEVPQVAGVYYYGGAYRDASLDLKYAATLPTTEGTVPMNILTEEPVSGVISKAHTLPDGSSITRTFAVTSESTTVGSVSYVKCTETTDWATVAPTYIIIDELSDLTALSGAKNAGSWTSSTNYTRANYLLVTDLTVGTFTPIGGSSTTLCKTCVNFEGAGYMLNNVTVSYKCYSNATAGGAGLFAYVVSSNIQNLYVNGNISGTGKGVYDTGAVLAGRCAFSTVTNCHVSGSVFSQGSYGTGGIIGGSYLSSNSSMQGKNTIKKCSCTATVKNDYRSATAGIIGSSCIGDTIEESWFCGTVNGYQNVGGIAASQGSTASSVSVKNCWVAGTVTATGTLSASASCCGIYGGSATTIGCKIENCYSLATVKCKATTVSWANPIAKVTTTNTFFIGGRFYASSATATTPTNSGYANNATECADAATLVSGASAVWSSSVWNFSGTYPSLINNPGMPA